MTVLADLVSVQHAARLLRLKFDENEEGGRQRALVALGSLRVFWQNDAGADEIAMIPRRPEPSEIDWLASDIRAETLGMDDDRGWGLEADHPVALRLRLPDVLAWRRERYPGEPEPTIEPIPSPPPIGMTNAGAPPPRADVIREHEVRSDSGARKPGRPDEKRRAIMEKMRDMDREELRNMKQEALSAQFGYARSTCERARRDVLSENVDN